MRRDERYVGATPTGCGTQGYRAACDFTGMRERLPVVDWVRNSSAVCYRRLSPTPQP